LITIFAPLIEWLQGADNPDTVTAWSNLAKSHLAAGRTNEAIPLLERTVAGCERLLGPNHRDTVKARNNLAMCYRARANGRTAGGQRSA
jgi:Tetratricopeptide repeat